MEERLRWVQGEPEGNTDDLFILGYLGKERPVSSHVPLLSTSEKIQEFDLLIHSAKFLDFTGTDPVHL